MLGGHPVFPILLSTDMEASRAFYGEVLGLELLREDEFDGEVDRLVFRCGDATQLVISRSTVGTTDTQTQAAWRVADIREAVGVLRSRGVRVEEYESPAPVTVDGVADMVHSWAAWFVDPSGNVLAIVEPKP